MKRTTLAERAASIIFEGIEAKGDEFVLRASSLERLGALVLEAAKTDDFGAVAREVSTVMGFLSSKEGTRPICDALSALGSEMRVALGPQIERMMLDLGESHAERGAGRPVGWARASPRRRPTWARRRPPSSPTTRSSPMSSGAHWSARAADRRPRRLG